MALLIETSRGYGRGLLRGIVRYARLHGPWSFYVTPGDFEQALPRMRAWGGSGIIARIESTRVARAIVNSGLPVVALDLSAAQRARGSALARLCEIHPDPAASARMAAAHLAERGFKRFAFVGITGRLWSERRREAFVRCVEAQGGECFVYDPPARRRAAAWERDQPQLAAWLASLPAPVGLMACNDDRGRQVLEACLAAGISVPDDIAVVGMDDDDLLCELCEPPLSSVALNTEKGGYDAAALLDRLMAGGVRRRETIVVEPVRVVTRRSTDVLAVLDRRVAAALRFIREHAGSPIRVHDVSAVVPMSRRGLEVRFRRVLGRSINEEIQRAHVGRAKQLLAETDCPIGEVAERSGFKSQSYLGHVFRRLERMTPRSYRQRVRGPR